MSEISYPKRNGGSQSDAVFGQERILKNGWQGNPSKTEYPKSKRKSPGPGKVAGSENADQGRVRELV